MRDADARGGDIGLLLTPRVGKGVPQGLSAVCFIDVMTLNVMTAERYLLCGVVVLLDPWPQPQSFHVLPCAQRLNYVTSFETVIYREFSSGLEGCCTNLGSNAIIQ